MFFKSYKKLVSIEGMKCNGCANHIKEALLSIDGVKKVNVEFESKTAVIVSKSVIDDSIIESKITELGKSVNYIKEV